MTEKSQNDLFEMKYNDEEGFFLINLYRMETPEHVHLLWSVVKKEVEGKESRRVLVDISKSKQKTLDNATRKAYREYSDFYRSFEKFAYVITTPVLRMLAKATISVIDTAKISKFFKIKTEAIAWLKGEK